MPNSETQATLTQRVQRHLAVQAPEPWPSGEVDTIAELLERASRRGESGIRVAVELAKAAAERQAVSYEARGCDAAVRCGHHLSRAAASMPRGWSGREREKARALALQMYDRAICSPDPNTRAWAHLKSAYVLVDGGDPKEAWHHAQMATFHPETPAMAAYYDQLHAALRDKITKASDDPKWLPFLMVDAYA